MRQLFLLLTLEALSGKSIILVKVVQRLRGLDWEGVEVVVVVKVHWLFGFGLRWTHKVVVGVIGAAAASACEEAFRKHSRREETTTTKHST